MTDLINESQGCLQSSPWLRPGLLKISYMESTQSLGMEKYCYMFMTLIKVVRNHIFLKIMKPLLRYCFLLYHTHDPKPKRTHQIFKEKYRYQHRQSEHISQNIIKIRLMFHIIFSFSPQFHVFFLQPYA